MKFIIFQNVNAIVADQGYPIAVKISYSLNVNIVSIGVDKMVYFGFPKSKYLPFQDKLRHLKNMSETEENMKSILWAEENIKESSKLKNKSSQQIIAINKLKKNLEILFDTRIDQFNLIFNNRFDIETLSPLIDDDIFYFYPSLETDIADPKINCITIPEILQLKLPDPEKGSPLFFLNVEYPNGENILDLNIIKPNNPKAKNQKNFYGEDGFTFPILTLLSSYELVGIRKQLEEPTREFREIMEEWASICYANPNTNLGLDFFKKHLQKFLLSCQNKAYESPILNNALGITNKQSMSQIIIGEAPIEKIWEIYKISKSITEDEYNDLLKVKTEQFPKFEGRWPVVILKSLHNNLDEDTIFEDETVKSIRKTISLD